MHPLLQALGAAVSERFCQKPLQSFGDGVREGGVYASKIIGGDVAETMRREEADGLVAGREDFAHRMRPGRRRKGPPSREGLGKMCARDRHSLMSRRGSAADRGSASAEAARPLRAKRAQRNPRPEMKPKRGSAWRRCAVVEIGHAAGILKLMRAGRHKHDIVARETLRRPAR